MTSTAGPPGAGANAPAGPRPKLSKLRRRELHKGLPPWRRLRATRDFTRVERQGIRAQGSFVAVTVRPGPGRIGFVVSKKVDNKSHERNLIKRRLREIFRAEKVLWALRQRPEGGGGSLDVVCLARPEAKGVAFDALRADALATLAQAIAKLSAVKAKQEKP